VTAALITNQSIFSCIGGIPKYTLTYLEQAIGLELLGGQITSSTLLRMGDARQGASVGLASPRPTSQQPVPGSERMDVSTSKRPRVYT
jgi:hypothetical protein